MSLEQTVKNDVAELKTKVEAEFKALIAKVELIFGINNHVTAHITDAQNNVLVHIDNAAAGTTAEAAPDNAGASGSLPAGGTSEQKPPQEDTGNAGNGAGVPAEEKPTDEPATGAASNQQA